MADSQRKTANLWTENYVGIMQDVITYFALNVGDGDYTLSSTVTREGQAAVLFLLAGNVSTGATTVNNGVWSGQSRTVTAVGGYVTIGYRKYSEVNPKNANSILNKGTTALPYEPYGWQHSLRELKTATETIQSGDTIYADGTAATVSLKGNTVQNGTPTPSNPVDVVGVGERTENLWNEDYTGILSSSVTYLPIYVGSGDFTLSTTARKTESPNPSQNGNANIFFLTGNVSSGASTRGNGVWNGQNRTVTATDGYVTIAYRYLVDDSGSDPRDNDTMLNSGSTAKPYEPYGYKIPISSGDVTTNIYLGSTQTVRPIKSKVIPSDYSQITATAITNGTRFEISFILGTNALPNQGICTHAVYSRGWNTFNAFSISRENGHIYMARTDISTVEEFREWLADQSANGTPVRVWYAVSTPETAAVNEPLMKIGDYADTVSGITIPTITGKDSFDVLTTLKPSEVELTYTGWHDATVKEWDGTDWQ